jgi:hypothetical protein
LKKPPSLPRDTLNKVQKISICNGWGIALVAGPATLLTLVMGDWFSTLIGALVTLAGVIEINGSRLLKAGDVRGCDRIKAAQLLMMTVLCGYCIFQILNFNYLEMLASLPEETRRMIDSLGVGTTGMESLIKTMYQVVYGCVILASLLHQGGLFLFYRRSTKVITTALQN